MAEIIFKGQQSIDAEKAHEEQFSVFRKATRIMVSEIKDEIIKVLEKDKKNKYIFQYALLQLEEKDIEFMKEMKRKQ